MGRCGMSKRQLSMEYGFNQRFLETLIDRGVLKVLPGCTPLRPRIDPESLLNLIEGVHCAECGSLCASISHHHVAKCSGISLEEYVDRNPKAKLASSWAVDNRSKTEEQKRRQSEILKARFRTEVGEITRSQIREASIRLHNSGYREIAAAHLRSMNSAEESRERRRELMLKRWGKDGDLRDCVEKWHIDNRDLSLTLAFKARCSIKKKVSGPHQKFKSELERVVPGKFVTEYPVGYFHVDEAYPSVKLAVEVDGCYWHGCDVCGYQPVKSTKETDTRKSSYLKARDWSIVRVPTHSIEKDLRPSVDMVVAKVKELEGLHAA